MTELMRRRRALIAVQEGGRLPAAYQEVEWIEGDGNPYIDTGLKPSNTFGFNIAFSRQDVESDYATIGCRQATGNTCWIGMAYKQPYAYWGSAQLVNYSKIPTFSPYERIDTSVNYKNSRTVKINNTDCLQGSISTLSTFTRNFLLFGRNNSGTIQPRACRIYAAEFTSGNDVVANFIPCYRKSDGVIGMYDTIGKVFHTNSGSGTFTKGADVT